MSNPQRGENDSVSPRRIRGTVDEPNKSSIVKKKREDEPTLPEAPEAKRKPVLPKPDQW